MDDRTFNEIVDDIIVEYDPKALKRLLDSMLVSTVYNMIDLYHVIVSILDTGVPYLQQVILRHPLYSAYTRFYRNDDYIDPRAVNSEFFKSNINTVFDRYINDETTDYYEDLSDALANIKILSLVANKNLRKFILDKLDDFMMEKEEQFQGVYDRYKHDYDELQFDDLLEYD